MLTPINSYSLVVEMATGHAPFADDVLFGCVSKCEYTVAPQNDRKFIRGHVCLLSIKRFWGNSETPLIDMPIFSRCYHNSTLKYIVSGYMVSKLPKLVY